MTQRDSKKKTPKASPKASSKLAKSGESCAQKECVPPLYCTKNTKKCVRRGDEIAKKELKVINDPAKLKSIPKPKKERNWDKSVKQGTHGFNAYATNKMLAAGLQFRRSDLSCKVEPGKFVPSPPQQVVQYLVHPETSVDRFLVVHRTGLGKTFSMILGLDNFYNDPRAKAIIFPNMEVQTNFYEEIMKFPSRYRDFVTATTGITSLRVDPNAKADSKEKGQLQQVIDALALTGKMSRAGQIIDGIRYPAAPLRAMRYTIAGGSQALKGGKKPHDKIQWAQPENPLLRFKGYESKDGNPYSNMVVFMDEFHNLLHPDPDVIKVAGNKGRLEALRQALTHAKNSVIVGLTATPIVEGKDDAANILSLIKGEKYRDAATNEGFVSYFQELPTPVFAEVTTGTPPKQFPQSKFVNLPSGSLQLEAYTKKEKELAKSTPDLDKRMAKLHPYSSTGLYKGLGFDKISSKGYQRLLTDREDVAIKLQQVVKDVMDHPVKTLIMVHSDSGFKQMRAIWEIEAKKREGATCPGACWLSMGQAENKAETKKIDALRKMFNSEENKDGSKVQVVIVDSKFYEAGVSFLGVRRLILVDVPMTWASYMQRIGRVLRFCGHDNLPAADQKVSLIMYVTRSADKDIVPVTTDQYFLAKLIEKNDEMMSALNSMHSVAVDRILLDVYTERTTAQKVLASISSAPKAIIQGIQDWQAAPIPMDVDSRAVRAMEMEI